MSNSIRATAYDFGLVHFQYESTRVINSLSDYENDPYPPKGVDVRNLALTLDRLFLFPSWTTEIELLNATIQQGGNATDDSFVLYMQYSAQMAIQAANVYGLDLSDEVYYGAQELYNLNATFLTDLQAQDELHNEGIGLIEKIYGAVSAKR